MTTPARLREPHVLAMQMNALSSVAHPVSGFDRGARDALRWLITGGPGPLTGLVPGLPVTARAIVRELAYAEALIWGNARGRRQYAMGLEQALMWAEFVTPAPPTAADSAGSGVWADDGVW